MPSMPILSTPAFSEICSPRPTNSSGTPAVIAPNSSEVRKGSVKRLCMVSALGPGLAAMIEILDQRQEDQQQRHKHQRVEGRHAHTDRGTLAADLKDGEEHHEGDRGNTMETRKE